MVRYRILKNHEDRYLVLRFSIGYFISDLLKPEVWTPCPLKKLPMGWRRLSYHSSHEGAVQSLLEYKKLVGKIEWV